MAVVRIKKGRDIKLKGAAEKKVVEFPLPQRIGIYPSDFRGLKPSLTVKPGDFVKVGTPIFTDKIIPEIKVVSPVSGRVAAINRGEKRVLLDIVLEADSRQEVEVFSLFTKTEIPGLSREVVKETLLKGGLWPAIRQRPFSKVAHPQDSPKAIFIHAMNTEPLALDIDYILQNRSEEFQTGLNIIRKLSDGPVHLCAAANVQSRVLTEALDVQIHLFEGPHPTGNVSTHIHSIDPIKKGGIVWYIEAQDVLRIASLFLKGVYPAERIAAITGEGAQNRVYAKTILGAPLSLLLQGSNLQGMRCISGSILTGKNVGPGGFIGFYDSQITVIPEGGKRKFLGWLVPGFNSYSFSKTFVSSFLKEKEAALDTDKHGSDRAIVLNHVYDQYVPLNIMTFFLLRAVIGGDIEEAEKLGILECDEEDFALCTFACPSKTDVGGVIRQGLDMIEKEG